MADITGTMMGRYQILEKLGEGGMAAVYKAFDTRLEREVALKVITDTRQGSEHFLKRFEREAKSLAKLSHPNIVDVHDYGEHNGLPYIVMEYLPNGTLKKFMGHPVEYRKASELLLPVAEALAYAHEQGIIHRDIKPANILLSAHDIPMVTDFGIVKVLGSESGEALTQVGSGIGTPTYMAPEQGQGAEIDQRADVYALGVVFYEMLTGRKPYEAPTPTGVFWKQMTEPLPNPKLFVPSIPDSVVGFLQKALAVNVDTRVQTMREFADTLKSFCNSAAPRYSEAPTRMAGREAETQLAGAPSTQPEATLPQSQSGYNPPSIQTPPPVIHYDEVQNLPPSMPSMPAYQPAPVKKKVKIGVIFAIIGGFVVLGVICVIGILLLPGLLAGDDVTPTAEAVAIATEMEVQMHTATEPAMEEPTPQPRENPTTAPIQIGDEAFQECLMKTGYTDIELGEGVIPVICDNFDDNRNNWFIGPSETDYITGNSWMENGTFHVEMTAKQDFTQHWKWIPIPLTGEDVIVRDFMILFKVRRVSGTSESFVGMDYRETEDFLYYSVTMYENTGSLTLEYYDGESYTTLTEVNPNDWKTNDWNQFAYFVLDSDHYGLVNNTELDGEDSQDLQPGALSLWIGVVNTGESVAYAFDDLVVLELVP
ncbi:MAG: serine/threonine protein kinase [Anaerolineae bacterium]|nr:serine/threonine protein kinase [Anaerolineae bacterium]